MGQKFKVFRVENKNGYGPYRNPNQTAKFWLRMNSHVRSKGRDNVPPPWADIQAWDNLTDDEQSNFCFGFTSLNQLKDWFNDVLLGLFKEGYRIKKYEVDEGDILFGQKQVAFRKVK